MTDKSISTTGNLENSFCRFESHVKDQHDQHLLHGFFVDWEMAKSAASEVKHLQPHHVVENAVRASGGTKGGFFSMILPPINELEAQLELDDFPEKFRQSWVDKKLRQHVKKQADLIKNELDKTENAAEGKAEEVDEEQDEKEEELEPDDCPTLLLCKSANLVCLSDENMLVNPNIPVPDWFRCANFNLMDANRDNRVLPLLRQHSSVDQVYSAVECDLEEFEKFKELHSYGVHMKHDESMLWNMTCNYTKELLKREGRRRIREVVMFKERTLTGVLISGASLKDMHEIAHLLDITLV